MRVRAGSESESKKDARSASGSVVRADRQSRADSMMVAECPVGRSEADGKGFWENHLYLEIDRLD